MQQKLKAVSETETRESSSCPSPKLKMKHKPLNFEVHVPTVPIILDEDELSANTLPVDKKLQSNALYWLGISIGVMLGINVLIKVTSSLFS